MLFPSFYILFALWRKVAFRSSVIFRLRQKLLISKIFTFPSVVKYRKINPRKTQDFITYIVECCNHSNVLNTNIVERCNHSNVLNTSIFHLTSLRRKIYFTIYFLFYFWEWTPLYWLCFPYSKICYGNILAGNHGNQNNKFLSFSVCVFEISINVFY